LALPSAVDVPGGHGRQAVELPSTKYWPAAQHTEAVADVQRLAVPAAHDPPHATGVADAPTAVLLKKYPAFAAHARAPAWEEVPSTQGTQADAPAAGENVPGRHREHSASPPSLEYVPGWHGWHAVEVPSTKYCPGEQQTGAPAGVHRVSPELQAGAQELTFASNRNSRAMVA
jgi:hypothetical protein